MSHIFYNNNFYNSNNSLVFFLLIICFHAYNFFPFIPNRKGEMWFTISVQPSNEFVLYIFFLRIYSRILRSDSELKKLNQAQKSQERTKIIGDYISKIIILAPSKWCDSFFVHTVLFESKMSKKIVVLSSKWKDEVKWWNSTHFVLYWVSIYSNSLIHFCFLLLFHINSYCWMTLPIFDSVFGIISGLR